LISELIMGSLFNGVAMFPLAAQKNGIKAVWASEIEKFPIAVSRHHFPYMKHLGDICGIGLCTHITHFNGTKCNFYINTAKDVLVKPVDIITFSSPCQDLSVAGKRAGLAGERSGLFSEATRIIREMRFVTDGMYPKYAIWENVPGAFSSNKGQDFRTVLEEITKAEIPMPKSGKWANAGMVRGDGYSVAWRVCDAQYWGVAQRRKRIFLVADFRGQRAGEILFESESMSGNFEESGETRKETAGSVGNGVKTTILFEPRSQDGIPRIHQSGICPTLNTAQGGQRQPCIAQPVAFDGYNQTVSDKSQTIRANKSDGDHVGMVLQPQTYVIQSATMSGDKKQDGLGVSDGHCYTLDCRADHAVCYPEPANTLLAKANMSYRLDVDNIVRVGYVVRRLMPIETERLMSMPDNWTNIPGASDTARYKAIGNSLVCNIAEWIFSQIVKVAKGDPQ